MASYGYSTPYHGMAGGALPQGYMEAATAPGRLLGQGIASLGQNIQAGINQYMKNRDEENYLNAKIDAGLAQYAQAAAQSGGTMPNGDAANVEQAAKIIGEKNAKKLFEGNASRSEKLSIAHALETYGQTQLQALERQRIQQGIENQKQQAAYLEAQKNREEQVRNAMAGAIQYAGAIPKTTTTTETQLVPTPTSEAESAAAKYYMGRAAGAAKRLGEEATRLYAKGEQPAPAPELASVNVFGLKIPTLTPADLGQAQATAQTWQERNQAFKDQAAQLYGQAQILSEAAQRPLVAGPQSMKEVAVQTTQQVPYEKLQADVLSYLQKSKAPPEVFGALDKILATTGMQKPLQVEQTITPEGISVIRADGKIDIVPPVRQPNQPLTEADKAFMSNVAEYQYSVQDLKDTIQKFGTSEFLDAKGSVKLNSLPYKLAIMYAKIADPGSVAREGEVEAAKKFLIPTGILARKESALAAIDEQMKEISRRSSQYEQITGRRIPGVQQMQQPSVGSPEAAKIKALFQSGKISKQEAVKQLQAIK